MYPLLGFDTSLFLEDFPQKNLVREYVSDQEMYEKLVEIYESRAAQEKLFLFGITMQNHGAYDYIGDNYTKTVSLEGYTGEYPDVEQYLSLLHESDQALEYLVNYFSSVDEDVVIVFYGDHQPALNSAFYEELIGKSVNDFTLDDRQLQYTVPFIIWANYDIEERDISCTSLNNLANYLYEAIGMELPPYRQFLSSASETIPAMNSMGYFSQKAGHYMPYDAAGGEEAKILEDYWALEYNSLFDHKSLNHTFFPLDLEP